MNYQEKKQARIERYKQYATNAEARAQQRYQTASKMAEAIPFGQPMLVDHHSYKSDLSYRKKIDNNMRKSIEETEKAEYYYHKAEAAAKNNAISSDDDQAIEKLEAKIKNEEEARDKMKAINLYYRKHKTLDGISEELLKPSHVAILKADIQKQNENQYRHSPAVPFAAYALSNAGANIRSNKKRLEQLKAVKALPDIEEKHGDVVYKQNVEANRIQLIFPGKPSDDIRTLLKSYGFRWSPTEGAWQRQISNGARYAAETIIKKIQEAK